MKELSIGEVTITSIIERDGPWRTPEEMFPAYDPNDVAIKNTGTSASKLQSMSPSTKSAMMQ